MTNINENMSTMGTVNVENIPIDKLKVMLGNLDNDIEKLKQEKQLILSEIKRRSLST